MIPQVPVAITTMPSVRSTAWFGTVNNYNDEHIKAFENLEAAGYPGCACGRETAPDTGTPHLQFVFNYGVQSTRKKIKEVLGEVHCDPMRGTWEEATTYCRKEGDMVCDYGRGPEPGKRNDLERVKRKIDEDPRVHEADLFDEAFNTMVHLYKGSQRYRDAVVERTAKKMAFVSEQEKSSIALTGMEAAAASIRAESDRIEESTKQVPVTRVIPARARELVERIVADVCDVKRHMPRIQETVQRKYRAYEFWRGDEFSVCCEHLDRRVFEKYIVQEMIDRICDVWEGFEIDYFDEFDDNDDGERGVRQGLGAYIYAHW